MPASFGERVVMRILDTDSIDLSIEKLGFQEEDEQAFIKAINSPQGMVLVTGPTGSGKSTTLYAALNMINDIEKNRIESYGRLSEQVDILANGTRQLEQALRSPTSRGKWGEVQLQRILELAGMSEHVDFNLQKGLYFTFDYSEWIEGKFNKKQ